MSIFFNKKSANLIVRVTIISTSYGKVCLIFLVFLYYMYLKVGLAYCTYEEKKEQKFRPYLSDFIFQNFAQEMIQKISSNTGCFRKFRIKLRGQCHEKSMAFHWWTKLQYHGGEDLKCRSGGSLSLICWRHTVSFTAVKDSEWVKVIGSMLPSKAEFRWFFRILLPSQILGHTNIPRFLQTRRIFTHTELIRIWKNCLTVWSNLNLNLILNQVQKYLSLIMHTKMFLLISSWFF